MILLGAWRINTDQKIADVSNDNIRNNLAV
jgi:hypothetical protein